MTAQHQAERVLVALLGLALFAFGFAGLVLTEAEFRGDPLAGTVNGETWLGVEGNGWTFFSFMAAGIVLFAASATRPAAKMTALVVGLVLATLAAITLIDGSDVLGVLAANDATALVWAGVALLLVFTGLTPRAPEHVDGSTPMDETPRSKARFEREEPRERCPTRSPSAG
jgi:hypothetical protein